MLHHPALAKRKLAGFSRSSGLRQSCHPQPTSFQAARTPSKALSGAAHSRFGPKWGMMAVFDASRGSSRDDRFFNKVYAKICGRAHLRALPRPIGRGVKVRVYKSERATTATRRLDCVPGSSKCLAPRATIVRTSSHQWRRKRIVRGQAASSMFKEEP